VKYPEKVVADVLVADPAVGQVIGDRVFPVLAPASAALPFVTWRRTGVIREQSLGGPVGLPTVSLAVDMYAEQYEDVRDLADRCRQALDGWGGKIGNYISVELVSLANEADGFVQLAGGDLPPIYSVTQTYTILWQEI
jgi:hypothetical protein